MTPLATTIRRRAEALFGGIPSKLVRMPMRVLAAALLAVVSAVPVAAQLTVVSAASYARDAALAPDSIVSGFSPAIAAPLTVASSIPLPEMLAGYSVQVRDATGTARTAGLFAVTAGQINFHMPGATATGNATITLRRPGAPEVSAIVRVADVAPGLFTANSDGRGAPAGTLLRVAGESRTNSDLFQFAGGLFLPRAFALESPPAELYLTVYGTGMHGWRSTFSATLGGVSVRTSAPVSHSIFVGLDQVNIGPLPVFIADWRGELDLVLTADGISSNAVTIAFAPPVAAGWARRRELLQANSELAVAELGGRIYVMGGYPANRQTQATVQVYDPIRDLWELTTPLPIPLNHNMAAAVNGKLYMIGGQLTDAGTGNFSDRVFEYDPATREWRERARMPTARGAGVAVVVDGKIYVAGGRPPRGADFAVYDLQADSWRTLPDLPTQRNHLAGGALGGKVYIVGGRFEGGATSPQSDAVEMFDPATNQWAPRARLPRPRGGINSVEAYGCLHVFGGEGNTTSPSGLYPDHDVYNPVTNAWTSLEPMPVPVHGVTGAVFLSGLIYLPGGGTSQGGNSGSLIHQVYRPVMVCR